MLLFLKFRDFAWGTKGTTIPNLGSAPLMMQFETKAPYYYLALGLLAIGLAITYRIEKSWMGYYLVAIGEDEDAAEAIGVNAPKVKRDIYMVGPGRAVPLHQRAGQRASGRRGSGGQRGYQEKELVGEYGNGGREWQPRGKPVKVRTHDFPDAELGKAIPYGIYDLTTAPAG